MNARLHGAREKKTISIQTMKQASRLFATISVLFIVAAGTCETSQAEEWSVPVGGNAYRSVPASGPRSARRSDFNRSGSIAWGDAEAVYSVYFHVDRPATLNLAIRARVPQGQSTLVSRVGSQSIKSKLEGADMATHEIGRFDVPKAGYVRVDVQGLERSGQAYAEIRDLLVSSETEGLALDYVKSNRGNMFYWGRRGPSVHLRYKVPRDRDFRYAYSEITVPKGQDPLGSYFMANGFSEGYFGFQVNSPKERRVLFSVWSPFKTNNPREIPEDQRITMLGKGPEVHVGKFGNEGSGGQSFLVYPWKAGNTYCFLTEVVPDGRNSTTYTSWFSDKSTGRWRLIASFRRPKTETHLRGFHSFLESFSPNYGHIGRRAFYGNVWVCDVEGRWDECTSARLSVDATGRGRHRLDFTGGTEGESFFMRNCGFFSETGNQGKDFERESSADQRPDINFESLPRG